MRAGLVVFAIVVVAAVVAALNALFIINPTQQALVLQFGQVKNTIREPGLNVKVPFIQDVMILDKRILDLNVPAQEIIAADQKRLVVDAFMRYRIRNPVEFFQTVNNVNEGSQRLNTFVQASLRAVLADATFTDIVRDNRPDLMQRIKQDVAARAEAIGVEIIDVKIRRADLPEANSAAIYRRMQTEREQEAREIRAQGAEAARRIEAAADRTATVLRAEARRQSEQIRGEGDAKKSAIFAAAFSLDPDFFDFYRSMQAYEQGLSAQDTRLVLSPDTDFFRYLGDPRGAPRRGGVNEGLAATPRAAAPAGEAEPDGEAAQGEAPDAGVIVEEEVEPQAALDDEESRAKAEGVRQQIEEIAGDVTAVEPVVGTSALSADSGDIGAALQQESEATATGEDTDAGGSTSGAVPADEASTEAAVDTAEPAPSDAANAAAEGTLGEDVPQEDIPAMSDPDENDSASSEAASETAPAATDATAGEAPSDATTATGSGDTNAADATGDEADETTARE
ncbi:SPFH domain-containing protein [Acuticoccus sp. I52.16.1]|uniref:SPFH domain-containing protein n=1 Tax=Acuticoccus sp. I52.16.1 TaxID=2928472 RepID=UPI001FD60DB6|nr:SPFH domain-containing protein [Acuticoccus sp. I52.16.1]UOM34140.1 SPFH domain-containing protein [Acuticoccus sp. I52.16.1]